MTSLIGKAASESKKVLFLKIKETGLSAFFLIVRRKVNQVSSILNGGSKQKTHLSFVRGYGILSSGYVTAMVRVLCERRDKSCFLETSFVAFAEWFSSCCQGSSRD